MGATSPEFGNRVFDNRPDELKLLINDYWWTRYLLSRRKQNVDLPLSLLKKWLYQIEAELLIEYGLSPFDLQMELAIAGADYTDPSDAPYQALREADGGKSFEDMIDLR